MGDTVICEKEKGIFFIRLNRPEKKNAISMKMREELSQVVDIASEDREIRVIVITGGEDCFCVGADVKESGGISCLVKENPLYRVVNRRKIIHSRIENLPKPTIAAVNGLALGAGLELALACDFRIASETAVFGFPEIKLGGLPVGGGTQRLARMIGIANAKEMILTGEPIDVQEAYRIGLVNRIVPKAKLMEESRKMAGILMERPPLALTLGKFAINTGSQMDIESALDYEASFATILYKTEDREEGIKAFSERRKPDFKGK